MSVASPQQSAPAEPPVVVDQPMEPKFEEKEEKEERKSRSRSASRSKSRSRSRSESRGKDRKRSRSRSRSRSPRRRTRSRSRTYSPVRTDPNGRRVVSGRIHVSDFSSSLSKRELERSFEKFGKIKDLWMATYPPYYAFITYKHAEDAERAIRKMNEEHVSGSRVRVAHALPKREPQRSWGRNTGSWGGGPRRRFSPPPRRSGRSRSRDRGDRRRSRSRDRRDRSHSRHRSRSGSR